MLTLRKLRTHLGASALTAMVALAPAPAALAQTETITEENIIAGTMDIDFGSRTKMDASGDLKAGSPAVGAADVYKFALRVAQTTEYQGEIKRLPNLFTKTLQRKQQEASLAFDINLGVLNPKDLKQKKVVGKWVGLIPIDAASGAFDLAGGASKERPLRIAVDAVGTAKSFVDNFAGRLIGKAEKKEGLTSYTFRRIVGDKTVTVTVKQSDPMRFENIVLAKGPSENYPRTTVSGRLDYDYETGNWYTDGIRFRYTIDGKEVEDVVTGSIKWVEDADRASNGKGYYDFNLRFNEEKHSKGSTEAAAFDQMSEEDAFFAVDNSIPCLSGRISYVDSFIAGSDTPASSKVNFALNANKLTKQQAVNFFKLWLICTGPTNDE
ncbi:MAG TPA: hypothetical protein DEB06_07520 [Phycisphaerales bacterium]|nr:hypothetical protein [Phycisphaerales bacterium]